MIRSDRDDGYAGVAILIKKSFCFKEIILTTTIEGVMCIGAEIHFSDSNIINFYSLYNEPKNKVAGRTWNDFFQNLKKNIYSRRGFQLSQWSLGIRPNKRCR